MKKILIFYASYGGGHLSAAKSIENVINTNYKDTQTKLIDCMKYVNKGVEKLTTAAYRQMAKKAPWAWGHIYSASQKGILAHISTRSNKIMAVKLLKLLKEEKPDLVISTHPFGSQMCSYLKRKQKVDFELATIMTDFAPHDQWLVGHDFTNYYFVAHEKMKDYLVSKGIDKNKVFATGIPLSDRFLQKYDKKEILKQLEFEDNKKIVLFFGGGEFGLGKTKTVQIFKSFIEDFNDLQIIAIAGKNLKMKENFEKIVDEFNKQSQVRVLEYTNKVPEFMSISDIVVTKPGGLTTTESLASNLPMIIINPIPGQEEENAEFLESKGIAKWIKKDDNPKENLENIINNQEKLDSMKKNTSLLENKYSTHDICSILLKK